MTDLYCPKDYNLGESREASCNVGGIPCPEPRVMDPAKVVTVTCGPCGRSWGVPIGDVMKGRVGRALNSQCRLNECAATVVPYEVPVEVIKEVPAPALQVMGFDPAGPDDACTALVTFKEGAVQDITYLPPHPLFPETPLLASLPAADGTVAEVEAHFEDGTFTLDNVKITPKPRAKK